ncbi:MAG: sulfurtransferase TusA family protein [Ahrensia sp.]|nr:sulfurtransferase TusA family protein [Ahrensia sp.]
MTASDFETIDLRGYRCPLPVLKTRKRMIALAEGERICVLVDDPLAGIDIPNFCRETGQVLIEQTAGDGAEITFILERRSAF